MIFRTDDNLHKNTTPVFSSSASGSSLARAHLGSNQTGIADTTWIKIQLATEDYDALSEFDSSTNYRFVASVAGTYSVKGCVSSDAPAANKTYRAAIYLNGTKNVENTACANGTPPSYITSFLTTDLVLAVNDYLELYTFHNHGSNVTARATETFMSVARIA